MGLGLAFWIVYLIAFIFSAWRSWPNQGPIIDGLPLWLLLGILGWHAFGPLIHGGQKEGRLSAA